MGFTKYELKTGDVVTLRNQERYIVIKNAPTEDMIIRWESYVHKWENYQFIRLEDFGEKLEYGNIENTSPLDIVLVCRPETEEEFVNSMCLNDSYMKIMFAGGKVVLSEKSMCHVKELIEEGYRYTDGESVRKDEESGEKLIRKIPELRGMKTWFNLAGIVLGMQGEPGYENVSKWEGKRG